MRNNETNILHPHYDIVVATDTNYCKHVAALFLSILHTNADASVTFHLLSMGCSDDVLQQTRDCIAGWNAEMKVYAIDGKMFEGFTISNGLSLATYCRLQIPNLLIDVDKVLYLDVDMIVNGSLQALWDTSLDGYACAGVADPNPVFFNDGYSEYIGYDTCHEGYINAGMMLMNLDWWRKNDTARMLTELLANRSDWRFLDQDAINHHLHGKIKILDSPTWNYLECMYKSPTKIQPESRKWVKKLWGKPVITHFTARRKAWHRDCTIPGRELYLHYRAMTPWRNEPLEWSRPQSAFKGYKHIVHGSIKNAIAHFLSFFF